MLFRLNKVLKPSFKYNFGHSFYYSKLLLSDLSFKVISSIKCREILWMKRHLFKWKILNGDAIKGSSDALNYDAQTNECAFLYAENADSHV